MYSCKGRWISDQILNKRFCKCEGEVQLKSIKPTKSIQRRQNRKAFFVWYSDYYHEANSFFMCYNSSLAPKGPKGTFISHFPYYCGSSEKCRNVAFNWASHVGTYHLTWDLTSGHWADRVSALAGPMITRWMKEVIISPCRQKRANYVALHMPSTC